MPTNHGRMALLAAGLLALAGCMASDAGPCVATSVTLEATISDGAMDPSALSVCRDQDVTLILHSETDGEFHLHGYDSQVPETSRSPDESVTLEFTADVAGQFIMELHMGGDETEIGVFTVNEP
jgi:hypothetical protein